MDADSSVPENRPLTHRSPYIRKTSVGQVSGFPGITLLLLATSPAFGDRAGPEATLQTNASEALPRVLAAHAVSRHGAPSAEDRVDHDSLGGA